MAMVLLRQQARDIDRRGGKAEDENRPGAGGEPTTGGIERHVVIGRPRVPRPEREEHHYHHERPGEPAQRQERQADDASHRADRHERGAGA